MKDTKSDIDKIKEVLEELRPFFIIFGGDVEFIKYDEKDNCVYVKLSGACAMCMSQDETLEYGLLEAIKECVPAVKKIINTPLWFFY